MMPVQAIGLELNDAERPIGGRLLKLVPEIDRVEGYSEPHAMAIAQLAVKLGRRAGLHGSDLTALKFASLAHDVGERALKREYLLRPGKLTAEERLDLVRHSILGEQAAAQFQLSRSTQLFIRWHHEWWNGYGYPDCLAGEAIPLGARILRAADTYCALVSDRPYRPRHDPATAKAIIEDQAGIECDPRIVKLLIEILAEEKAAREAELQRSQSLFSFSGERNWLPVHEVWDSRVEEVQTPAVEFETSRTVEPKSATKFTPRNRRWLGFELSVLRRLKFTSIAIPFAGRPDLEWYLKFWGRQILNNDVCQWSWWMSRGLIENPGAALSVDDVELVLSDAYTPRRQPNNPALWKLMREMDACWFDNVWLNIQQLSSDHARALAYLHALDLGDYVRSFSDVTESLRRPLSEAFTALWRNARPLIDNGHTNLASNRDARDFIRGVRSDCMFVRLPRPEGLAASRFGVVGWRETWVRGSDAMWDGLVSEREGRLGDSVHSKEHYLELASDFFERARHIPKWVIAHSDSGFMTASEVGDLLRQFRRRVEVTYAKDFSGVLGGSHAYILIAS